MSDSRKFPTFRCGPALSLHKRAWDFYLSARRPAQKQKYDRSRSVAATPTCTNCSKSRRLSQGVTKTANVTLRDQRTNKHDGGGLHFYDPSCGLRNDETFLDSRGAASRDARAIDREDARLIVWPSALPGDDRSKHISPQHVLCGTPEPYKHQSSLPVSLALCLTKLELLMVRLSANPLFSRQQPRLSIWILELFKPCTSCSLTRRSPLCVPLRCLRASYKTWQSRLRATQMRIFAEISWSA
ncbi:uncharacterized protein V1518DRAFT_410621, partial [Limtongia smithiae]|uniref:uncharacterized protein n=1 Tax=Limtongia smithiae TaxID=1125753 RepID=UPI0034CDFBF7